MCDPGIFVNCRMSIRLMGACVCIIVWFCSVEGIIYQSKANLSYACHFEPFARRLVLKCTYLCINAVRATLKLCIFLYIGV